MTSSTEFSTAACEKHVPCLMFVVEHRIGNYSVSVNNIGQNNRLLSMNTAYACVRFAVPEEYGNGSELNKSDQELRTCMAGKRHKC